MRDIKFRAWDKKNNKMLYEPCLEDDECFGQFSLCRLNKCLAEYNFELMQYTGLKDKNNKEIYEGDILSMHNGQYNSQVIYKTPEFIADHIGNGGSENLTTWIENHEVIGNIYENLELLKE